MIDCSQTAEQFIVFDRKEFNRWWGQAEVGGTAHRIKAPDEMLAVLVYAIPKCETCDGKGWELVDGVYPGNPPERQSCDACGGTGYQSVRIIPEADAFELDQWRKHGYRYLCQRGHHVVHRTGDQHGKPCPVPAKVIPEGVIDSTPCGARLSRYWYQDDENGRYVPEATLRRLVENYPVRRSCGCVECKRLADPLITQLIEELQDQPSESQERKTD